MLSGIGSCRPLGPAAVLALLVTSGFFEKYPGSVSARLSLTR